MIELLAEQPLLLLFIVAAIGYPLGRIRVGGFNFGVAAVLFAGIAVGALDERLKLPEIVYTLGLVLFVYTIGLSSGPGFFASLRRKGVRDNALVLVMVALGMAMTIAAARLLSLPRTLASGLFAGSLTNTPALASILESLKGTGARGEFQDALLAEPVVGYSIAYPMGVIGMLIAIYLLQRLWKVDYRREALAIRDLGQLGEALVSRTARVTKPTVLGQPVGHLIEQHEWQVIFGRRLRAGHVMLVNGEMRLAPNDLVSIIGPEEEVAAVVAALGEESGEELALDRHEYDFRRMFVSNPSVAGRMLSDLQLHERFGAIVSRVRRGDSDLLPHGDTILALGDRVRVVAPRDRMQEITRFFGDSYRALSEIDVATFSLGITLGLLLGAIPIPLPGGVTFRLGLAGGPLLVALILGKLGRTGPLAWNLPYSANLTLRQIGLILFLAGVGTRSGYAFVQTLASGEGIRLFVAGALITTVVAFTTLVVGYKLLRIPMGLLIGILSGLQTQPALLGFALEQSENELPNIGYATVYPVATIAKILVAQVLLALLAH